MGTLVLEHDLSFQIIYTGFYKVESWWNYENVISPFSRLYLITKGEGAVYMQNRKFELKPNQLLLIPKFVAHRYECTDWMEHYYICFIDSRSEVSGRYLPLEMNLHLPSSPIDVALFQRLLTLNPHKSLPVTDPKTYDNRPTFNLNNKEVTIREYAREIESNGILMQLYARFIADSQTPLSEINYPYDKFEKVMNYIHSNLHKPIKIPQLADIMCFTPDHFSKLFKKIHGISPCEHIQLKRVEKAQTLMITTQKTISEIAAMVGIPNLPQFYRLFVKHTNCSPRQYRVLQYKGLTPLENK